MPHEERRGDFYEKTNYAGTSHTYNLGGEKLFYHSEYLNDKLKSVEVGELIKVLAWQHSDQGSGNFETLGQGQPHISS